MPLSRKLGLAAVPIALVAGVAFRRERPRARQILLPTRCSNLNCARLAAANSLHFGQSKPARQSVQLILERRMRCVWRIRFEMRGLNDQLARLTRCLKIDPRHKPVSEQEG
jgi:hypothetical protein